MCSLQIEVQFVANRLILRGKMLKIHPVYMLLVILISKEINGAPQYGFDVFDIFDDSVDSNKDTKLTEKNGKIFSDWFSALFDYFLDESVEDTDKYLICKNCTVIVGQDQNQSSTPPPSNTNQGSSTEPPASTKPPISSSTSTQPSTTIDVGTAATG